MSRKNFKQPKRLAGPLAQCLCVVLLLSLGGSLYAEDPPQLWKFGGDAQPIDDVSQSHKDPKITQQEISVPKDKKENLSKNRVLHPNKQEDSLQLPKLPVPDGAGGAGTSKLRLKKEGPQTSGPTLRAAGVLQKNRLDDLQEGSTALGDAHLLLMGTGSEIRFRGIGQKKSPKAQPIPVLELPSEKPNLVVKKISHTIEEHADAVDHEDTEAVDDDHAAPIDQEDSVAAEKEYAVATDEEHSVPVDVPSVKHDHQIVTIDFLRSASPLVVDQKDNAMRKARPIHKARRPEKIQGPFGYSR